MMSVPSRSLRVVLDLRGEGKGYSTMKWALEGMKRPIQLAIGHMKISLAGEFLSHMREGKAPQAAE